MEQLQGWLSIWELTRASGITGYLLLFLATIFGVLSSIGFIHHKWKTFFTMGHQYAGWLGFLFSLFHGLILYYNTYVPYTWAEILVPFVATENRFWLGLGILSLYGMLIVLLSSEVINKLGRQLWKKLHYLAFVAYAFALLHGIILGTDIDQWWGLILYASTGSIVVSLILIRVLSSSFKKKLLVRE